MENQSIQPSPKSPNSIELADLKTNEIVASFFDLDQMAQAIVAAEFTPYEEMEWLIKLVRNDAQPSIQLKALKQYRDLMREMAEMKGLIGQTTATRVRTDDAGIRIEESITTKKILPRAKKGPTSAPQQGEGITYKPPKDPATLSEPSQSSG